MMTRTRLIGSWLAAIVVLFACTIVAGGVVSIGAGQLWLAACLMPPAVMFLVWPASRGLPEA